MLKLTDKTVIAAFDEKAMSDARSKFLENIAKVAGSIVNSIDSTFMPSIVAHPDWRTASTRYAVIRMMEIIKEVVLKYATPLNERNLKANVDALHSFKQLGLTLQSYGIIFLRQYQICQQLGKDYSTAIELSLICSQFLDGLDEATYGDYISLQRTQMVGLPTTSIQELVSHMERHDKLSSKHTAIIGSNSTIPKGLEHYAIYQNSNSQAAINNVNVKTAVCRRYLKGECTLTDCKYLHPPMRDQNKNSKKKVNKSNRSNKH